MKTRIGFSTPNWFNPVSWLVRKFTKSKCSHTWFVYYDVDFQKDMVMEAHELGFRLIAFEHFKKHNNIVAIIEPSVPLDEGLVWASDWLGSMYNYVGLFGTIVVLLGRMLRKKWNNPVNNTHGMFCSEMAVKVLQLVKHPSVDALVARDTTPQDLLDFMMQMGKRSST